MTDHVCAWAAASPARYRASSSAMAASKSSRSNTTTAAIRSSASISTMSRASCRTPRAWSRPEKRARMRARRSPRVAMTVDVTFVTPDVGGRPHVLRSRRLGRVGSRRSPPDGDRRWKCRRPISPPWRPSRRPRSAPEALDRSACRVFQPRCRPAEFLEPRERGVEVCLVEDFAAVDQVAFDRQERDPPPLGVEALLRGPMRRMGDDRSEVAQPMHSLDVG